VAAQSIRTLSRHHVEQCGKSRRTHPERAN
jgi:hypothetical protein